MKKLFIAAFLLISGAGFAQTISSYLFGQNAFMPDSVGTTKLYGKLHSTWQKIEDSKVQIIRYGGNDADNKMTSNWQYLQIIDSARAHGMEPIIQVPFDDYTFSSTQAANLVYFINVTHSKNVVYWTIGNEENNNHSYGASSIATYIKAYSSAMKAVDNNIKIVGPDIAGYNYAIMTNSGGLLYGTPSNNTNNITGTDANGRYYVDIISFHTYPFGNLYSSGAPTRQAIIDNLRTNSAGHLKYDLDDLNTAVSAANSARSGSPLKIAVTEFNISYTNDVNHDGVGDLGGANSFIAGQFLAEAYEIAMEEQVEFLNFWSVIEGSPSYNSNSTNMGYLDNASPYNPKPTYYHTQLLADNFSGTYCSGTTTHTNVKAFGSTTSSTISVMLLNEHATADYSYSLDLNTSGSGSIKINASNSGTHSGTLYHQSTVVLVFDLSGNLLKECTYSVSDSSPNCTTYGSSCNPPTAGSNSPVCAGSTISLTASTISGASYSWTGPNGFTSSSQNPSITNCTTANAGTYSVTATVGSCTSTAGTVAVTVSTTPSTPTAGSNSPVCQGNTINLTCNTVSGATYSWTGPASFTSSSQNPSISGAGVNRDGTYSVTVTVGGCTSAAGTTAVTIPNFSSISPGGPTTFCSGGSVVLNASTGSGYSWQWRKNISGTFTDISGATANNYTVTQGGDYDVRIYNGTCYAWSAPITITVTSGPSTPTAGSNSPVCQGNTINLTCNTVSGATYSWTGPASFTSSSQNPSRTGAGVNMDGTYSVTVTVGGCTSAAGTTAVTIPNFSSITPGGPTTFCSGGSVVLNASTGSGYSWQWRKNISGTFTDISGATANNYTVTQGGDYDVRIYNGTCYAWSAPTTVTVNTTPSTPTAGSNSPVCQGNTINLTCSTVSGATYSWTGPNSFTSSSQNPGISGAGITMSGTYSVTVTVGGCTSAPGTTSVTVPDFASIGAGGSTTFCSGGSVTLYAATGTGYSWQWRKKVSGTFTDISGATANNYTASPTATTDYDVRIYNGTCYAWSAPTTVTINSSLVATITPGGPTTFCSGGNVVLHANTCSGYTYQWRRKNGTQNYSDISGATSANYTATVADWFQVKVSSGGSDAWSSGVQTIINCRTADTSLANENNPSTSAGLSVFPNPSKGEFTIEIALPDENDKIVSVSVLNALGQLVYSTGQISVTNNSLEIPVAINENYPDGIYIIRAMVGDKVMYSKVTVWR